MANKLATEKYCNYLSGKQNTATYPDKLVPLSRLADYNCALIRTAPSYPDSKIVKEEHVRPKLLASWVAGGLSYDQITFLHEQSDTFNIKQKYLNSSDASDKICLVMTIKDSAIPQEAEGFCIFIHPPKNDPASDNSDPVALCIDDWEVLEDNDVFEVYPRAIHPGFSTIASPMSYYDGSDVPSDEGTGGLLMLDCQLGTRSNLGSARATNRIRVNLEMEYNDGSVYYFGYDIETSILNE